MKKARLLKLADLLVADAKNKKGLRFDLKPILEVDTLGRDPTWDCGTTGCAIGLWGVSKKFQGVSMKSMGGREYWPEYKGSTGRDAAELYFGLTEPESRWLFLHHQYSGPTTGARGERAVAKRIRGFVAGKLSPPKEPEIFDADD